MDKVNDAVRVSEIQRALQELADASVCLEKKVARLSDRLIPVQRPAAEPPPCVESTAAIVYHAPIAVLIDEAVGRILAMSEQLDDQYNRCEA